MKETRKVQKAGYSSLAVSLPSSWSKNNGIKSGDLVMVSEDVEGYLKIFPAAEQQRFETKGNINADLCNEPEILKRIIAGCYLLGYDTIKVTSNKELLSSQLEDIRMMTKRLPGLEIVETTLRRVTVRCFVDPRRIPVEELMRKLHVMVTAIHNVSMNALLGGRIELAKEALQMENEIDQIYFLVVRQLLLALLDRDIASEIGIESPLHATGNRVAAKALEETADVIVGIAKEAITLSEAGFKMDTNTLQAMQKFSSLVQSIFGKTMKAFLSRDMKLANETLNSVEQTDTNQKTLLELVAKIDEHKAIYSLMSIIWNLGRILDYSKIIAEIAITRFLRQSNTLCTIEKEAVRQTLSQHIHKGT
jgi:phosphate uptake regulator